MWPYKRSLVIEIQKCNGIHCLFGHHHCAYQMTLDIHVASPATHDHSDMYINHITLNTGSIARTRRTDVADDVVAALRPWLKEALTHKGDFPLPDVLGVSDDHRAQVTVQKGAVVCTVFGPLLVPLMTFGVAARSRQAGYLWGLMGAQFGVKAGIKAPGTPWCAVVLHPAYSAYQGASSWVGEFVRSMAWTRIEGDQ